MVNWPTQLRFIMLVDHLYVVIQHFSSSVTVSFLCFTTNSVLVLFLILCEVSVHMFVHVCVQAKNSNGTTVRMFSNFNLLRGRCMLLPFPSALTSLCAPVAGNVVRLFQSHVGGHFMVVHHQGLSYIWRKEAPFVRLTRWHDCA